MFNKKLSLVLPLLLIAVLSFCQNITFTTTYNISGQTSLVSGNTYTVSGNVTDYDNVYVGSSVMVGDSIFYREEGIIYAGAVTLINGSPSGKSVSFRFLSTEALLSTSPSGAMSGQIVISRKNPKGYCSVPSGCNEALRWALENRFKKQLSTDILLAGGGGSTADTTTTNRKYLTWTQANGNFVKATDKGLKITNSADTSQIAAFDFPSMNYRTGAVVGSDLLPIYDGTGHTKIRVDSLKSVLSTPFDFITPEQYGAIGNNSTDDAAALQNAINYANAIGAKQILLKKTYKINSAISNPLGVQFVGGGQIFYNDIQLNSYAETNNLLFTGIEYLSCFHKRLLANSAIKAVFSGDSTTEENGYSNHTTSLEFVPLSDRLIENLTGKNITSLNAGHSGQTTVQWLSTYLNLDTLQAPNLYILKWGINDPLAGDINAFVSRYETGLQSLRAWRTDSLLSVVIMSPNSTSLTASNRDEDWYEQVNYALRELAKKYRCAYFDTYQLARNSRNSYNYMDNIAVHPKEVMDTWIASGLVDNIIPISYRVVPTATPNEISNITGSTIILNGSELPNSFTRDVTISRATVPAPVLGAATIDGAMTTIRQIDNIAIQFLHNRNGSDIYMRTGSNTTWYSWTLVSNVPNSFMTQKTYGTGTNIYRDLFYQNPVANQTGTYVIELPNGFENVNLQATICGFSATDAVANKTWEVKASGFSHATPEWLWASAQVNGNAPFTTVRLGRNTATGKAVIMLGGVSTAWQLPKIWLKEVVYGHSTLSNVYAQTAFTGSWVTNESGYSLISSPALYKNVLETNGVVQGISTTSATITNLVAGATSDSVVTANGGVLKRMTLNGLLGGTTSTLRIPRLDSTQITALNSGSGSLSGDVVYNTTQGVLNVSNTTSGWDKVITASRAYPQGSLTVGASPTTTIVVPITNASIPNVNTDITHIELWYQSLGTGVKALLVPSVDFTLTSISGNNVTLVLGSAPATTDKFYILIK